MSLCVVVACCVVASCLFVDGVVPLFVVVRCVLSVGVIVVCRCVWIIGVRVRVLLSVVCGVASFMCCCWLLFAVV